MKKTLAKMALIMTTAAFSLSAGSLTTMPLRVDLSAKKPTEMLIVSNPGDKPIMVQLNLVSWDQVNDEERYMPANAVLAVPSVFTIDPGTVQNIRIGLRNVAQREREGAYRLYLQEILPQVKDAGPKVQVALRIGIPVFVKPVVKSAPKLDWKAACNDKRHLLLRARNSGNAHAKILDLTLSKQKKKAQLASKTVSNYILSGKERRWEIPLSECPKPGTKLEFSVLTDTGHIYVETVVEK